MLLAQYKTYIFGLNFFYRFYKNAQTCQVLVRQIDPLVGAGSAVVVVSVVDFEVLHAAAFLGAVAQGVASMQGMLRINFAESERAPRVGWKKKEETEIKKSG